MTLETAIIILMIAIAGIMLILKFMNKKSATRKICLTVLSLIAIVMSLYILACFILVSGID